MFKTSGYNTQPAAMEQREIHWIWATNHPSSKLTMQSTGLINDTNFFFFFLHSWLFQKNCPPMGKKPGNPTKKMSELYCSMKKASHRVIKIVQCYAMVRSAFAGNPGAMQKLAEETQAYTWHKHTPNPGCTTSMLTMTVSHFRKRQHPCEERSPDFRCRPWLNCGYRIFCHNEMTQYVQKL